MRGPEAGPLNEVRARFGTALRECRVRLKLTQEQLAERSGLSYKFIGEIERGRGNPTLDTIGRLADALGVAVSDLLVAHERTRTHGPEYRITRRDLQAVREAVASVSEMVENLGSPTYPPPRRRKR